MITAILLTVFFSATALGQQSLVVQTDDGPVMGFRDELVYSWRGECAVQGCVAVAFHLLMGSLLPLGIPYASPPVGQRRWSPPVRPTPWSTTKNTTAFGVREESEGNAVERRD